MKKRQMDPRSDYPLRSITFDKTIEYDIEEIIDFIDMEFNDLETLSVWDALQYGLETLV